MLYLTSSDFSLAPPCGLAISSPKSCCRLCSNLLISISFQPWKLDSSTLSSSSWEIIFFHNIYLSLLLHLKFRYQIIMINFINQVILPLLNVDCRTLDQTRWMCYGKRLGLSESFWLFRNRLSYLTYKHQIFSTSDAF